MPQAEGVHFQRAIGPVVCFFIPQSGITNSLPLSEAMHSEHDLHYAN